MVIHGHNLLLSFTDLHQWFSNDMLKTKCHEHRQGLTTAYLNTPDPADRRRVLIDYDSIPLATRIAKGMPTKDELLIILTRNSFASTVIFSTAAHSYYLQQPPTARIAKEKAEQASWLLAIASATPTQCRALGFPTKAHLINAAVPMLQEQARTRAWHAFKVSSPAALRKRLKPFIRYVKECKTNPAAAPDTAFASLVTRKAGNTNAAKLDIDQQALLIQIYADPGAKPNFEQTWFIYARKAQEMIALGHWPAHTLVSPSAVRYYLMRPNIRQLWFEARHGLQAYRQTFEPVTSRKRPSYANALWVIDGTPSHRYFQHGDKGRYFRFSIFPILDAHSWCVLGFWLSETETTDAVLGALRSACWVSGCLPHQVLYDNSSAIQSYRAQAAIDTISVVAFPATAGNARAKIIENFFHLYNQDVQKYRPGFTANPFALRLDNRPNREALARMVRSSELPQAEHALNQAIEDLTIWNNLPRKFLGGISPLVAYRKSVEATRDKQRPFTDTIDIAAFYQQPGQHKRVRTFINTTQGQRPGIVSTWVPQLYTFTNRGIELTVGSQVHSYDIDDPAFRATAIGQQFAVRFEPDPQRWSGPRPDQLLLYHKNGTPVQWNNTHLCALPKEQYAMAVADYTHGERTRLHHHLQAKKTQRAIVQSNFDQLISRTKANGTHTPVITANAFDKEVLQATQEQVLNQIIEGEDYRLTRSQNPCGDDPPAGPAPDRLAGYDQPIELN